MDLAARAAACLAVAAEPAGSSPAWAEAVRRVRAGDGAGAAAALAPLDDRARSVTTAMLERLAVREGKPDEVVRAVGKALANLQPKALSFRVTGWLWDRGWRDDVAGRVGPERLAGAEPHGHDAARQLLDGVRAACAKGDLREARDLARRIDPYHKERAGVAWCLLAAASPPHEQDDLWDAAVKAAKRPPMIQHGAEESEALAEVVGHLATHVAADHPAVENAWKALLKLGKTYAPKDARSTGLARAAAHAARRGDAAWLARAEALLGSIHSDHSTWTPLVWIALGRRRLGDGAAEQAALARIAARAWTDAPEVRALYPDRVELLADHWSATRGAFDEVRLIRAAGGDVSAKLDAAISGGCHYHRGAEGTFGQLVELAHAEAPRAPWTTDPRGPLEARAHAVLVEKVKDRGLAFAMAALHLARTDLATARGWLGLALDAGLKGRDLIQAPALHDDPALFERVELAAAADPDLDDRSAVLTDLAELALRRGDVERALGLVGRVTGGPARDETPVWTPSYRRGDRAGWAPWTRPAAQHAPPAQHAPTTLAEGRAAVEALPEAEQRDGWWALAARLSAPDELRFVRDRLARGKAAKYLALLRATRLLQLDLRLGEVEAALAWAGELQPGDPDETGVAAGARRVGAWLLGHPEARTPARALALVGLFARAHPAHAGGPALDVLPDLLAALAPADREAALVVVRTFAGERVGPSAPVPGPPAFAVEAVTRARVGEPEAAARLLAQAVASPGRTHGELLARAVAEAGPALPGRAELLTGALGRCVGEAYQLHAVIERTARRLWLAGDVTLLPPVVAAGPFSSDVKAGARRSLVVDAVLHAPRPVEAVLAAWADAPPNVDQAREQVAALAAALEKEGRAAEAGAVRATLG